MLALTWDRAGVLILRCWIEGDPATGLRVRIVAASGAAVSESPVTVVTDVASTGAAGCAWLEESTTGAEEPSACGRRRRGLQLVGVLRGGRPLRGCPHLRP
jgi:hypothetical protein